MPFDERRGVVPNVDGRVIDGETAVPGLYVAGWIKRGPTGIVGTNKKDAHASVASLLADAESGVLTAAKRPGTDDVDAFLADRGVQVVSTAGWRAIDAAERALGAAQGRDRTTIHDRTALLRIAASAS